MNFWVMCMVALLSNHGIINHEIVKPVTGGIKQCVLRSGIAIASGDPKAMSGIGPVQPARWGKGL